MDTLKHLLVIEDDQNTRFLLKKILGKGGLTVDEADNGIEGLKLLEKNHDKYGAIILDWMMPEMDGIEVLSKMKKEKKYDAIPVVMQTGKASQEDFMQGLEAGVFYYLVKPYRKEILLSVVQTAVKEYSRYKKLQEATVDHSDLFSSLNNAEFEFCNIAEGNRLAIMLAKRCPNPSRAVIGLSELFINAIEHGNLGITYEEKSGLVESGEWNKEVERRLALPENYSKKVKVKFERKDGEIHFLITDSGPGFNWRDYIKFQPSRVFDNHGRGIAMAQALSFNSLRFIGSGNQVHAVVAGE